MSAFARCASAKIHVKGAALSFYRNLLLVVLLAASGFAWASADATLAHDVEQPAPAGQSVDGVSAIPADSSALSPRMLAALDYVKRRYKVSRDAVTPLFETVQKIARERGIDPLLIVALIGIESGFNAQAKSATGGHGLMQVIPRFHLDKIPDGLGAKGLLDPLVNVRVGTMILDEAIRRAGSTMAGLRSYNGSDKKGLFANRVLAEKARLESQAR